MANTFLVTIVMFLAIGGSIASSQSPTSNDEFSPLAPSPALSPEESARYIYLEDCAAKLTPKCGAELFNAVFEEETSMSYHCCIKLTEMRNKCHTDMVNYSIGLPQFQANASLYVQRSEAVWKTCSLYSVNMFFSSGPVIIFSNDKFSPLAPSPALSPAESAQYNYLEECAAKLTEKCSEELFSIVFENGTSINSGCCRNLMDMGKKCNTEMVKYSIGLPQYKENASLYVQRSEKVWNTCSSVSPNMFFNIGPIIIFSNDGSSQLAPSPALSHEEAARNMYLEDCADKLTVECGEELFNYIFESGTSFSDICCERLVLMGKKCDTEMVKYNVGLSQYKASASLYLGRSAQLWNKCISITN